MKKSTTARRSRLSTQGPHASVVDKNMKIVEFKEQTTVYAKDQPHYRPLPAHQFAGDPQGRICTCWELTKWERVKLLFSGKLWHQVLTFNKPLQPQLLSVEKPLME